MLDKTKPIVLTRSFYNSRGNYYPAKETPYQPGEITEDAWEYMYAAQYVESENKVLMPIPDVVITPTTPAPFGLEQTTLPGPNIDIEITEPSTVRELTPSEVKTVKTKMIKHTNQ